MTKLKILLAGPGTGKTTKIKEIIKARKDIGKVLILSFTNATISDLLDDFGKAGIDITEKNCMTLHKYAMKMNHLTNVHILNSKECLILEYYAKKFQITFDDLCKILGCMTFEHMITSCTKYIQTNAVGAKRNIGDIDLFIVDEYQDFNEPERKFIDSISQFSQETIILGDDDQCIYGFKSADSDGIITLYNDPAVEKIDHENICYRCPDSIVTASNKLISKNQNRVAKVWQACSKEGELILEQTLDEEANNKYFVSQIKKIKETDPEGTILLLSKVSFGVKELLAVLDAEHIEYVNWWDNKTEAQTMVDIWTLRTLFGKNKILNIMMLAYSSEKKNPRNWKAFLTHVENFLKHGIAVEQVLQDIEKTKILETQLTTQQIDFEKFFVDNPNFEKFKTYLEDKDKLDKNLEKLEVYLKPSIEFDKKKVNIMSIHKSKGLQADYVFINNLIDGILPKDTNAIDSIEAERRLLFVGMSRTRKRLYLVSTVLWEGKHIHKANKDKFKYDYRSKKYTAQTSVFVQELEISAVKI